MLEREVVEAGQEAQEIEAEGPVNGSEPMHWHCR